MNRVEAVERAARELIEFTTFGIGKRWENADSLSKMRATGQATAALDASGYPAALTEAIELLRDENHERIGFGAAQGDPTWVCAIDSEEWPCPTARFLAEHDETT